MNLARIPGPGDFHEPDQGPSLSELEDKYYEILMSDTRPLCKAETVVGQRLPHNWISLDDVILDAIVEMPDDKLTALVRKILATTGPIRDEVALLVSEKARDTARRYALPFERNQSAGFNQ